MTCPYEVPVFNDRLGIVRKCDMCRGRLVEREAPACVQGCPNSAIRITIVNNAIVRALALDSSLTPGAASSMISRPATRFISALTDTQLETLTASDVGEVTPAHAHDPLAIMLVLTQVGAGLAAVNAVLTVNHQSLPRSGAVSLVAVALAVFGIAASLLHLGRPSKAWKVVIGITHSWLSREAVALGAFVSAGSLHALMTFTHVSHNWLVASAVITALLGVVSVASSAMVYAVTGRAWWSPAKVMGRFFATAVCGGSIAAALITGRTSWALVAGIGALIMTAAEINLVVTTNDVPSIRRTAHLLQNQLRLPALLRVATLVAGAGAAFINVNRLIPAVLLMVSALIERSLFFRAVSPDRMPGWWR
jgi:formate dehydrogenase iron-sulfur subunit